MSVPSLTSLLKQSHVTDHDEVLRVVTETLRTSKNDVKAQHAKIVALLKLDRFDDAARAVETGDATLKEQAKLEYAYALYKVGRRKEAAKVAQGASSRGLRHIEAQALYSLEEFVQASELYKSLSQDAQDDNIADLRVNTLAVNAQLEWKHQGQHVEDKIMTREDFEAHETVYNTACISIARGELGQCEILLKRAKSLCENLQDLSEEEKASELLPINLQHIFVLTRLGRHQEASELAASIDHAKIPDAITSYLARVNTEAAKLDTANPFLLERQLSVDLDRFEPSPPFGFQRDTFVRNQYALDLGAMKFEGTAASTQSVLAKGKAPTTSATANTISVVYAAAHSRNQGGKEALKHILPLLAKRPDDLGLVLAILQIYVLNNNTASAIELLEKFLLRLEHSAESASQDVRYAPGVVGTLVSLLTSQGRQEKARTEFKKAADHWQKLAANEWTPGVVHLLKAAGSALLGSAVPADIDQARAIFEAIRTRDTRDKYAAAGLIAASRTAQVDSDRSALTTLEKLTANIDVDALERAGIAQRTASTSHSTASAKKRAAPSSAEQSTKIKKIRKSKLPKDYDPAKTPDPERWLPLRDRSTYKPKGKKSKAKQAMLSQGAVAPDSEGSRPATPGADVVKAKAAQPGSSNNKKKKAKGKK